MESEGAHRSEEKRPDGRASVLRKIFRALFLALLSLVALVILTSFIVQIPFVQSWGVKKLSAYFSNRFDTEIKIDHFEVNILDHLEMDHLLIRDLKGDTLLYSGIAQIKFDKPLFSLFKRRLDVSDVKLLNARGYVHREAGQAYSNLQLVFNPKLRSEGRLENIDFKGEEASERKSLNISAPNIALSNVVFVSRDEVKGNYDRYIVPDGSIGLKRMDVVGPVIELSHVRLNEPVVEVRSNSFDDKFLERLIDERFDTTAKVVFPVNFELSSEEVIVHGGRLRIINNRNPSDIDPSLNVVDFKDLSLEDINVQIRDLDVFDWSFYGIPDILSFQTQSGFCLNRLAGAYAEVTPFNVVLEEGIILTENSTIYGDVNFRYQDYRDFKSFADNVIFDHQFESSIISVEDLLRFVPALATSEAMQRIKDRQVTLEGQFTGSLNDLKGRNVELRLGEVVSLDMRFDTRNLTLPGQQIINARVQNAATTVAKLQQIIPNFKPDPSLRRLETLIFEGQFDGYLDNFVAFGTVRTKLGRVDLDMQMNLMDGTQAATYSGQLNLVDFDLGAFTDNADLGLINVNAGIPEGRGLSAESIDALADANIQSLSFKGYDYQNLEMDGRISSEGFNGDFSIEDEHIDLEFNGQVIYNTKTPEFNVTGAVRRLNLQPLNLSEKNLRFQSEFELDVKDYNIDKLIGYAALSNVRLSLDDEVVSSVDNMLMNAVVVEGETKNFTLSSPVLDANFTGKYRLIDLKKVAFQHLVDHHSVFASYLEISSPQLNYETDVDFELRIKNSQGLMRLLDPAFDTLKNITIGGFISEPTDRYSVEVSVPTFSHGNKKAQTLYLLADGEGAYGNIVASFESATIGKSLDLSPFTVFMDLRADTIDYTLNTADLASAFDNLNLQGKTFLVEDKWQIEMDDEGLELFGDRWNIKDDNYVRVGKQFLRIRNWKMSAGDRSIELQTIDDKGIELDIAGLTMDEVDALLQDDKFDFSGDIFINAAIPNIFDINALSSVVRVDSVNVNGDAYGDLLFKASMEELTSRMVVDLKFGDDVKMLEAGGTVSLKNNKNDLEHSMIDIRVDIDNYPMKFLEYFIRNGMRKTSGGLYGDLTVAGRLDKPDLEGIARIEGGGTNIDILGTRYNIGNEPINVTSDFFDFTNVSISDKYGNTAYIEGGLTHSNLKDFGLDVDIVSNNFLVLNTKKSDGEIYYGHCLGDIQASFDGSFDAPTISLDAESRPGTRLYILVEDEEVSGSDLDFVDFVMDTVDQQALQKENKIRGVDFTLNLVANEEADVEIIFDELTRDIIYGNGRGDILLSYSRSGELKMYGDYEIEQGRYAFKNPFLGPVQISKPFEIVQGGALQWTGDPFNADIDIEAKIAGLQAAPYNFISEYLQSGTDIEAEASQVTKVDLTLFLTGKLLEPNINFQINFPVLDPRLKALTDRKLAELAFDQNQLNLHAATLLAWGDFIPTDFTAYTEASVAVIANTVSEWISNQISYYLTNIFDRIFGNVGFVDDVEFDFGYVLSTGEYVKSGTFDLSRNEIRLGNKFNLFDRRLVLDVQGNIVNQSDFVQSGYFAPYVAMEYVLTKDRRWRIRAYRDQDYGIDGERFRYGLGLSFRREFDSFDEFMKALRKQKKKDQERQGSPDTK